MSAFESKEEEDLKRRKKGDFVSTSLAAASLVAIAILDDRKLILCHGILLFVGNGWPCRIILLLLFLIVAMKMARTRARPDGGHCVNKIHRSEIDAFFVLIRYFFAHRCHC